MRASLAGTDNLITLLLNASWEFGGPIGVTAMMTLFPL